MLTFYLIATTVVLLFLAIAWTVEQLADIVMKVFLSILSIIGVILTLQQFGFVIQTI